MRKILKVSKVNEGSNAEQLGIIPGDVITACNGRPISTNTELATALYVAKQKEIKPVDIIIQRGSEQLKFSMSAESLGVNCEEAIDNQGKIALGRKSEYKTDYGVALGVSSIISFVGWALVVLGGVMVVMIIAKGGMNSRLGGISILAILPRIGTSISGFFLVMGAQVTKAVVDNADHTREILGVIKSRD